MWVAIPVDENCDKCSLVVDAWNCILKCANICVLNFNQNYTGGMVIARLERKKYGNVSTKLE